MSTDGLKQLWKTVFGDPDIFIDAFFDIAYSPLRCRWIEDQGQIVSALYWLDCQWEGGKLAYIYAVATHPDHRGKGLATQLLRDTHAQLKAEGYAGAVLKPAAGLFPFYERLGYCTNCCVNWLDVEAGSDPVPLTPLTAREHSALRKSLLPLNAVCQDGCALEFFHRFARVYAAEKGLISIEPETASVVEYLGDPSSLPGILAVLGIRRARVRVPGTQTPFTMYHPLNCTKMPGYLGITLE